MNKVYHKAYGDMSYQDYINSWMWKDKRDLVLRLRGYECERCGSKKHLNVHHLTYETIGNEGDEDMIVLCRNCHKKEHGIEDNK